jgi:tetratricopeptide (TPR) repeat protein
MDLQNKSDLEAYLETNTDSKLRLMLADMYLQENDLEQAGAICRQEITRNPRYPVAYYLLAMAEVKSNETTDAIEHLKQTIALDSGFLEAYYKLIEIGHSILSPEVLESYYLKIAELNPMDENARREVQKIADKTAAAVPEQPVETDLAQPETAEKAPEKELTEAPSPQISEEEAHLGPIEPEPESAPQSTGGAPSTLTEMFSKLKSKPLAEVQKEDWTLPVIEEKKPDKKKDEPDELKPSEPDSLKDEANVPAEPEVSRKKTSKKNPTQTSKTKSRTTSPKSKRSGKNDQDSADSDESGPTKVELKIPVPTFTLVEVFKKQKLYDEALQLLDVLEKRSKNKEKIARARAEILQLKIDEGL